MRRIISTLGIFLLTVHFYNCFAQQVWTLERCIQHAIEHSLLYESGELNQSLSEIDLKIAQQSKYPNLSGSSNLGWNFGRTIDPTNNAFVTETFFNNGFGLNSGVMLYNANRINNSIKQAKVNAIASNQDLKQIQSDIALRVSTLFLNSLFAKENLKNVNNQLELTKNQADALRKQILVGNRPENDQLDFDAQIAANEQAIVEAQNTLYINLLNLKQLLRISPDEAFDITTPLATDPTIDPDIVTFAEVYNMALQQQAGVKAAELRYESAEISQALAKADLYPSLSAGLNARTNFSNKGVSVDRFDNVIRDQEIFFNGVPATIGISQQIPVFVNTTYLDQITDNLSYGLGIQLTVPIYNNYVTKGRIQQAKINTDRASLNLTQIKEDLKITVGQALADAKAAKVRYQATQKTLSAQTNVYNNAVKRFEIGNLNTFELTRLKTQMETSAVNTLNAKFEYLFRTKVLEFYLGRPIKL